MLQHHRQNESSDAVRQIPPPGGSAGQNRNRLREAGESFLQAADQAVERALSGNSLAFLEATRQEGGQ